MKKNNLIIILLIMFSSSSYALKDFKITDFDNSIGIKTSNISGYGFYYTRDLNENFKIQFMGFIYYYYNEDADLGKKSEIFNYDIGAEIQRNLFIDHNSRFYLLLGAYYYRDDDTEISKTKNDNTKNNSYNIGVGVSYEYFWNRFLISFDVGYKFFEDHITYSNQLPTPKEYPALKRVTKLGGGIGVGFMF